MGLDMPQAENETTTLTLNEWGKRERMREWKDQREKREKEGKEGEKGRERRSEN